MWLISSVSKTLNKIDVKGILLDDNLKGQRDHFLEIIWVFAVFRDFGNSELKIISRKSLESILENISLKI